MWRIIVRTALIAAEALVLAGCGFADSRSSLPILILRPRVSDRRRGWQEKASVRRYYPKPR
jgi:hypothetical protein